MISENQKQFLLNPEILVPPFATDQRFSLDKGGHDRLRCSIILEKKEQNLKTPDTEILAKSKTFRAAKFVVELLQHIHNRKDETVDFYVDKIEYDDEYDCKMYYVVCEIRDRSSSYFFGPNRYTTLGTMSTQAETALRSYIKKLREDNNQ